MILCRRASVHALDRSAVPSRFPAHAWLPMIALLAMTHVACNRMPGRPADGPEVVRPDAVKSFDVLYAENCAGCHGADGQDGPATDLANPVYQAFIDDNTLRDLTAKGQQGTMMPGFAISSGGPLTDAQVEVLVTGMRSRWAKPAASPGLNLPSYAAQNPGRAERGQQVYAQVCARCHGAPGGPPGDAGSILDGAFLGLVSDQVLRTTVVTGRPDFGMPDWRTIAGGRPLSDQDISDVVAWLASQRPSTPGRPYRTQAATQATSPAAVNTKQSRRTP